MHGTIMNMHRLFSKGKIADKGKWLLLPECRVHIFVVLCDGSSNHWVPVGAQLGLG